MNSAQHAAVRRMRKGVSVVTDKNPTEKKLRAGRDRGQRVTGFSTAHKLSGCKPIIPQESWSSDYILNFSGTKQINKQKQAIEKKIESLGWCGSVGRGIVP